MFPFRQGDGHRSLWLKLTILSLRDLTIVLSISLRSQCSSCRNWGSAWDEELLLPLGPGGDLAWIQMPSHAWGASLTRAGLRPTGGFTGSLAGSQGLGSCLDLKSGYFRKELQVSLSVKSLLAPILVKSCWATAWFPLHWGGLGGPLVSIRASVTVIGWDSCSWQNKDLRRAVSSAGWQQGMQTRRSEWRGPMSCSWIPKRLLLGNPWANPYLCVLGCNWNQYFLSIY